MTCLATGEPADTILVGGFVYTMERDQPQVEAVAIRDGRIIELGTSQQVRRLCGEKTEIVDLERRMVMPGLIDGHCHPAKGAIANLFSCKFEFTATPEEIACILTEFVEKNATAEWIVGGRWGSSFFERNTISSPRRWLDQYSGEGGVSPR